MADSHEALATVTDYRRQITVPVNRVEVEVPFDGESELFKGQPSTRTSAVPCARIKSQSIVLSFELRPDQDASAKATIDREIDQIERYLEWTREDVKGHNELLYLAAEAAIQKRRARILSNQGLMVSMGIPLRMRSDAPKTYAAPAVRRKVVPTLPPASPAP